MWCHCSTSGPCFVPPAPEVMAGLYADYLARGRPFGLTFKQYLEVIGFTNDAEGRPGMDDGVRVRAAPSPVGPQLVSIPRHAVQGPLSVMVLLVDFVDRPGSLPASHYESLLFSKDTYATGSMRDFYQEVSGAKVDVRGEVHGWLRMPQPYSYYTNRRSGTGLTYPRNAQRLAEDAVHAALDAGVRFGAEFDALGQGSVTALFVVHAGSGAEAQGDAGLRADNIWSHKWSMRNPVDVSAGLQASVYLTVPHDAKVGVCAHELGHLAFQWEDFYDPNYDEDGSEWDGSGSWDLMAAGSWNGGGLRPAHPAALHKIQHGWIDVEDVHESVSVTLPPIGAPGSRVVRVLGPEYRAGQYLLLENRTKQGFDSSLPGEGMLVWRVDEAQDMFKPDRPALLLLQADGRHDLERPDDWNAGDAGDPFPGTSERTELDDVGDLSTTFPGGNASGIALRNITRDPSTGNVALDVAYAGEAPPPSGGGVIERSVEPALEIPDAPSAGVESAISLDGSGAVRELAVDVRIDHSYIGDLRVELVAPSGLSALLHDRSGGGSANLERVYRSSEVSSLAALAGVPVAGQWRLRVTDLAFADAGVLRRWGIAVVVDDGPDRIRTERAPALPIPDNDAAGVSDTVRIDRRGQARTIAVDVAITHPYASDLRVELVSPTGGRALLSERQGGAQPAAPASYSSADIPALAALVGIDVQGSWALRVADLASRDKGTLDSWALDIGLGASGARTDERHATPDLPIPDNDPGGIGSALGFSGRGTVQGIEIEAAIEHTYIGDLHVELVAPGGALAVLHHRQGGRTRDLALALTSATSPALAALNGQPVAGNWVLRVADLVSADVGRLRSWSLKLTYS